MKTVVSESNAVESSLAAQTVVAYDGSNEDIATPGEDGSPSEGTSAPSINQLQNLLKATIAPTSFTEAPTGHPTAPPRSAPVQAEVKLSSFTVETFDDQAKASFELAMKEFLGPEVSEVRVLSVTAATSSRRRLSSGGIHVNMEVTFYAAATQSEAANKAAVTTSKLQDVQSGNATVVSELVQVMKQQPVFSNVANLGVEVLSFVLTVSGSPTVAPSKEPTKRPTTVGETYSPTVEPTTAAPTATERPTTAGETYSPTTATTTTAGETSTNTPTAVDSTSSSSPTAAASPTAAPIQGLSKGTPVATLASSVVAVAIVCSLALFSS